MSVTLKLATSLDGRIATAGGESRWITGEAARAEVHRLREAHDAVLVGIGTVLADDPELTVRFGGAGDQPARVVLDSRQRLPLDSKLVRTARETQTVVITTGEPSPALTEAGVTVLRIAAAANGRPDLSAALTALAERGLADILVEGGGEVAAGFIAAGLIDRMDWFRAPIVLGAEGRPAIGGLALERLSDAPRFRRVSAEAVGDDLWERYERV